MRSLLTAFLLFALLPGCDSASEPQSAIAFDFLDGSADVLVRTSPEPVLTGGITPAVDSLLARLPFALPLDAQVYATAGLPERIDSDAFGAVVSSALLGGEYLVVLPGGTDEIRAALQETGLVYDVSGEFGLYTLEGAATSFAIGDRVVIVGATPESVQRVLERPASAGFADTAREMIALTDRFPIGTLFQDAGAFIGPLLGQSGAGLLLPFKRAAAGVDVVPAEASEIVNVSLWIEPDGLDAAGLVSTMQTLIALAGADPSLTPSTAALLRNLDPVEDGPYVRLTLRLAADDLF
jgi:hypothetical protein